MVATAPVALSFQERKNVWIQVAANAIKKYQQYMLSMNCNEFLRRIDFVCRISFLVATCTFLVLKNAAHTHAYTRCNSVSVNIWYSTNRQSNDLETWWIKARSALQICSRRQNVNLTHFGKIEFSIRKTVYKTSVIRKLWSCSMILKLTRDALQINGLIWIKNPFGSCLVFLCFKCWEFFERSICFRYQIGLMIIRTLISRNFATGMQCAIGS